MFRTPSVASETFQTEVSEFTQLERQRITDAIARRITLLVITVPISCLLFLSVLIYLWVLVRSDEVFDPFHTVLFSLLAVALPAGALHIHFFRLPEFRRAKSLLQVSPPAAMWLRLWDIRDHRGKYVGLWPGEQPQKQVPLAFASVRNVLHPRSVPPGDHQALAFMGADDRFAAFVLSRDIMVGHLVSTSERKLAWKRFRILVTGIFLAVVAAGVFLVIWQMGRIHQAQQLHELALASSSWPTVEGRIMEAGWQRLGRRLFPARVEVVYQYTVNGRTLQGGRINFLQHKFRSVEEVQQELERLAPGTMVTVAYDPALPEVAVLEPGGAEKLRSDYKLQVVALGGLIVLFSLVEAGVLFYLWLQGRRRGVVAGFLDQA